MPPPREVPSRSAKVVHRHAWLWEPLEEEPSFVLRAMFGAKAVYLDGRLLFCFCAGEEPWRGLLVCTGREHHASLCAAHSELAPHPILPKWLYLSETDPRFESTGTALVQLARRRDPRLGVLPRPKRGRPHSTTRPR